MGHWRAVCSAELGGRSVGEAERGGTMGDPQTAGQGSEALVRREWRAAAYEPVSSRSRIGYQYMRFLGVGIGGGDRVPDDKTIWLFREHLTQAGAVENLFAASTRTELRPAISPWAGRLSMPPSWRRQSSETQAPRRPTSKMAIYRSLE